MNMKQLNSRLGVALSAAAAAVNAVEDPDDSDLIVPPTKMAELRDEVRQMNVAKEKFLASEKAGELAAAEDAVTKVELWSKTVCSTSWEITVPVADQG